ncbi:MAG: hypothetical protein EXR41_02830 [Candidatus Methylopumilus sp.]|nr:hypothetical protein [Candidatus Methylopumilus sp.]
MSELQNTFKELTPSEDQSAWADLVICRVEVDLPNWLTQLAGGSNWQVYSESEYDHSISFSLRQGKKEAEVTLFHNGYAQVDLNGKSIFDGSITSGANNCAHLSYYRADNGDPIVLN